MTTFGMLCKLACLIAGLIMIDSAAILSDVSGVTCQINRAEMHLKNRIKYFMYAYQHSSDSLEILPYGHLRR